MTIDIALAKFNGIFLPTNLYMVTITSSTHGDKFELSLKATL
jgi:hypothetical protein